MRSRCGRRARVTCVLEKTGEVRLSFSRTGGCCQWLTRWEKEQVELLFATSVEFRKEIGSSSRKGKGEDVSKPREGSQEREVD